MPTYPPICPPTCRLLKDAAQVKTCARAFLVIQSHHDYCPRDTLTRYEEELFHEWESKCHGCSIVRKYDPYLTNCPVVDCLDTTVAELGYEVLSETCTPADTSYPFEWAASFDTPADSYTWVSQAATKANENDVFPAGHSYADPEMKVVAYAMTSTLKAELSGKKDDADELMSSGPCPEVTVSCTPGDVACASKSTITPTAAGACVTLKFPTDVSKDFYATVDTTGVAHVAFFTAHMPTEFERDTYYFMSTDLATDVEPANQLGGSGGHDHGRGACRRLAATIAVPGAAWRIRAAAAAPLRSKARGSKSLRTTTSATTTKSPSTSRWASTTTRPCAITTSATSSGPTKTRPSARSPSPHCRRNRRRHRHRRLLRRRPHHCHLRPCRRPHRRCPQHHHRRLLRRRRQAPRQPPRWEHRRRRPRRVSCSR